jgi:hypothetical protein
MAFKNAPLPVQRAEATFNVRQAQQVDAPNAVRDYRQNQQAALDQMHKLRDERIARERNEKLPVR